MCKEYYPQLKQIKKTLVLTLSILASQASFSQGKIEWSQEVELELSDYRSPSTEINEELTMYSINSTAGYEFTFSMSYAEFMFTRNFNSKVNTVFVRNGSYVVANTIELAKQLVEFGKLEFDLAELSARKFRKKLFEEKGAFSSTAFFQPLHDEIMVEQVARHSILAKKTNMGRKIEILNLERAKIRSEIDDLMDYCKTCKPPKKRKSK